MKEYLIPVIEMMREAENAVCPQACGKPWPACGCPTAAQKQAEADLWGPVPKGLRRRKRKGGSLMAMLVRLGATPPKERWTPPQTGNTLIDREANLAIFGQYVELARKQGWTAPEMKEDFVCGNCDGAPDGGHAGDEVCVLADEKAEECPTCGHQASEDHCLHCGGGLE